VDITNFGEADITNIGEADITNIGEAGQKNAVGMSAYPTKRCSRDV